MIPVTHEFWQTDGIEAEVYMCRFDVILLAGAGLLALPAMGQQPDSQTPQKKVAIVHTHDGGVTEVLQSIDVPPKAGAPFTLTLETEWVKQLSDGGTIVNVHRGHGQLDPPPGPSI